MPRRGEYMSWRGTGGLNAAAAAFALLLPACSGDPGTGPADVKWDRDACARCNMVLSDRRHAAQVRHTPADGGRSEVRRFDDFGCAVLWLDQQTWANDASVEIWVTDQHSGRWIDARRAHYTPGRITPMQYGLGAQAEASVDTLDFTRAREHVNAIERRFNIHGGNLDHPNAGSPLAPIQAGDSAGAQ